MRARRVWPSNKLPDAASEHRDPRVAELDAQIFKDDKLAARFKKVHPGETADPA